MSALTGMAATGVDGHVEPTGAALAAEIQGIALRQVDDDTFSFIHQAWLDHLVLLFRGQSLSDEQMIAFSQRFGEARLGTGAGERTAFRRGPPGNLRGVQRDGERGVHRQPGRW